MNAMELFHANGTATGIFYCGKCRKVAPSHHIAAECCKPRVCEVCGSETEATWYTKCRLCSAKAAEERELEKLHKAEKVTQWDGWVYRDGYGSMAGGGEGFAESLASMLEWCDEEDCGYPDYVWTCVAVPFVQVRVRDILERICEEAYEDFSCDDLEGVPALEAAVEVFNAANKDVVKYEPDYTRAVVIEAKKEKENTNEA